MLAVVDARKVNEHYGEVRLLDRLRNALGTSRPTIAELAPLDQFHSRGLEATIELAGAAGVTADTRVLDVGSGLGGPSRYLAKVFGCEVTGIDVNPSYVEAAQYLADRVGLASKVDYLCGNALALPFASEIYDLVWTQHVAMNIADRVGLYSEMHRVLRAQGRLALYDVLEGDYAPLRFPVPWSRAPDTSFLVTPDHMRELLQRSGFRMISWIDRTEDGIRWFSNRRAGQIASVSAAEPPALGLDLLFGKEFSIMAENLGRNLQERRALLIEAVLQRD
jgi:SAM-dependent methyltransferase